MVAVGGTFATGVANFSREMFLSATGDTFATGVAKFSQQVLRNGPECF